MNSNRKYGVDHFNYQKKFKPNVRRGMDKPSSFKRKQELYSRNWDDIRKMVYTRDNHRCVMCGRKGKVHAHHIVPVKVSRDNSLSNLVTVCERCHKKLEAVGFTILENGGSRVDVKRAEFRMIAEAKKKRLEKYNKLLEEKKLQEQQAQKTEQTQEIE